MAVNIFGFRRIWRGATGAKGKDGLSIRWFPESIARMFRENSICTYFFDTLTDGLVYDEKGAVVGLKNRSGSPMAKIMRNFQGLQRLKTGKYGVVLENTLFEIKNVELGVTSPTISAVCFTFKIETTSTESRFLFSNNDCSRALSLRKDRIQVWAEDQEPDLETEFETREWNTVFIQFSYFNKNQRDSFIQVNDDEPVNFVTNGSEITEDSLWIGGKPTGEAFAHGVIGSFQLYVKIMEEEPFLVPEKIYEPVMTSAEERVVKIT